MRLFREILILFGLTTGTTGIRLRNVRNANIDGAIFHNVDTPIDANGVIGLRVSRIWAKSRRKHNLKLMVSTAVVLVIIGLYFVGIFPESIQLGPFSYPLSNVNATSDKGAEINLEQSRGIQFEDMVISGMDVNIGDSSDVSFKRSRIEE